MTVAYDAGALVAADRGDRGVWADHRARLELGLVPITTAPVIAQVSRSPRQVQLRRFLRGCVLAPFSVDEAHEVGEVLARAGSADVVDAHLVVVAARSASTVLTSDRAGIERLSSHLTTRVGMRARGV